MVRSLNLPCASAGIYRPFCHYNISPQGDGNARESRLLKVVINYNISPQGDGNFAISSKFLYQNELQHIPARGRKRIENTSRGDSTAIATYPRKGTETLPSASLRLASLHCNLSPQGDGNWHGLPNVIMSTGSLQLIPARGRKLYRTTPILLNSHVLQRIPAPQGDTKKHLHSREIPVWGCFRL